LAKRCFLGLSAHSFKQFSTSIEPWSNGDRIGIEKLCALQLHRADLCPVHDDLAHPSMHEPDVECVELREDLFRWLRSVMQKYRDIIAELAKENDLVNS